MSIREEIGGNDDTVVPGIMSSGGNVKRGETLRHFSGLGALAGGSCQLNQFNYLGLI